MPYEAAKAVAATFCWDIRYALTPLFGTDFPSLCIPPHSRQFGKMTIDPEIIREATGLSSKYRQLEYESKMHNHSQNRLLSPNIVPQDISYQQPWAVSGEAGSQEIAHNNSHSRPRGISEQDQRDEVQTFSNRNKFTPINISEGAVTLGRGDIGSQHASLARTSTSRVLPSLKDFMELGNIESLCANPLKRRLNEDLHREQDAKDLSSRTSLLSNILRGPSRLRQRCDGERKRFERRSELKSGAVGDDSHLYGMSSSDEICSSSYASESDNSDSDSDLGTSSASNVSADSSDEISHRKRRSRNESAHRVKHRRQSRAREEKKKRNTERKIAPKTSSHQNRRSRYNAFRRNERRMSSLSPLPTKPTASTPNQKSKSHRHRDLKAAETLLALHSGSSTLSEDDNDDDNTDTGPSLDEYEEVEGNVKSARKRRGSSPKPGDTERERARYGLVAGPLTDLCERTIKRVRRASF